MKKEKKVRQYITLQPEAQVIEIISQCKKYIHVSEYMYIHMRRMKDMVHTL